jgi:hypothetical protein
METTLQSLFGAASYSRILNFDDFGGPVEDPVNMTLCLFQGTNKTYTDCCTDSSIKVCNYLMVMFFCCFILYAGVFIYIMNKK